MRKVLVLGAALVAGVVYATAVTTAGAETPFPAPKVLQIFVAAQVATPDRAVITQVAPGTSVIFRAYAVDGKTKKVLAAKKVQYFYVTIPNQPNVKLKYDPTAPGATAKMPWVGNWTVPAAYAAGTVNFKVLIKSRDKRHGQFVQMPITSSMLTVTKSPAASFTAPVAAASAASGDKLDVGLYVDSVNGTRPAAATPRPTGCTQTNVYKRGEQFVLRAWGTDMASNDVLSSENVDSAEFSVPGVAAPIKLNWGAHGTAPNQVSFWSNAWNIPSDYPLGDAVVKVTFKTDAGKTGTFDYPITIIP